MAPQVMAPPRLGAGFPSGSRDGREEEVKYINYQSQHGLNGESASPTPRTSASLSSRPTKKNISGKFGVFMLEKLLYLAAALPFGATWAVDEPPAGQELILEPAVSCPSSVPISCRNTTVQRDLCCFEAPGASSI